MGLSKQINNSTTFNTYPHMDDKLPGTTQHTISFSGTED